MHYCFEHDGWCRSDQQWAQHIELYHLLEIRNFCGLIRLGSVVVVAAHCVLCLGDTNAPLDVRFAQFDSAFNLHGHMREHLARLAAPPSVCPHPHCQSVLGTEDKFWNHAEAVHGMPPFGPRRTTGKRNTSEDQQNQEDGIEGTQDAETSMNGNTTNNGFPLHGSASTLGGVVV